MPPLPLCIYWRTAYAQVDSAEWKGMLPTMYPLLLCSYTWQTRSLQDPGLGWAGANLVEERQGLVGGELDGSMQGGDVILLEAQAQQDGCLQVGEVGRNVAAEVGLG